MSQYYLLLFLLLLKECNYKNDISICEEVFLSSFTYCSSWMPWHNHGDIRVWSWIFNQKTWNSAFCAMDKCKEETQQETIESSLYNLVMNSWCKVDENRNTREELSYRRKNVYPYCVILLKCFPSAYRLWGSNCRWTAGKSMLYKIKISRALPSLPSRKRFWNCPSITDSDSILIEWISTQYGEGEVLHEFTAPAQGPLHNSSCEPVAFSGQLSSWSLTP